MLVLVIIVLFVSLPGKRHAGPDPATHQPNFIQITRI